MKPSYRDAWPVYAREWDRMEIRPNRKGAFSKIAERLTAPAAKARYISVQDKTGVPWYMIALIHERESDQDWHTHLHNGDSLQHFTHHVPAGRPIVGHGPPFSWEESAIDALRYQGLHKIVDWRLEKIAYYLEEYNGWGYFAHHVPSAYLWAGSNVYAAGKYTGDGKWSANAVDIQPGCMPLLKAMMTIDGSIQPKRED